MTDNRNQEPTRFVAERDLYERAANGGDVQAMVDLGILLADQSDLSGARTWWEKAANAGHRGAMYNLGGIALNSEPPDIAGARGWYEMAAKAGHTDSMFQLGFIAVGLQNPPDLETARSWWTRAADAGNCEAMRSLGNLAFNSQPPEPDVACSWYEKAAELGDTTAMISMGFMCLEQEDLGGASGARSWWEKAAEAGDTAAMCNLGYLALQAMPPDFQVARAWYERAAAAGDSRAMIRLGSIAIGHEGQPDLKTARTWWEKAAKAGEVEAMFDLGRMFAVEWDPPDLDLARSWWEQAAAAGSVEAMYSLGILSASMMDPPDLQTARTWLEQAAAAGSTDAAEYLERIPASSRVKVSEVLRRSSLGPGWYVIREDERNANMGGEIFHALIASGACAVQHSGMFQSTSTAIAFPGGCLYWVLSTYGFGGLPEGMWLFGPTAVRQVFRLLGYDQPKRRLSGETEIPSLAELQSSWEEFATQDRLRKVELSLGALAWMRMPWLEYGRDANPEGFEPLVLPIRWTMDDPPPGQFSPTDPRCSDGVFWRLATTTVLDSTGRYRLRADGEMSPEGR